MEKRTKIIVGTNSLTDIQYPAYTNHCQFWFRLGRSYPTIDFIFSNPARMSIDRMRNMTAKVAIEVNADYILFLDDDVIVPPNNGLKYLLECDAEVAAGRVCVRGYPFNYMAFERRDEDTDGLYIMDKLPEHGILDVGAVGFSFVLLKVEPLRRMTEPWFITGVNCTEDIYYCDKLHKLDKSYKVKINCDCNCGHILWPEVICEDNRIAYSEYFKTINPQAAQQLANKPPDKSEVKSNGDRGIEYLKTMEKVIEGLQHVRT
jgi:hypothetical protein